MRTFPASFAFGAAITAGAAFFAGCAQRADETPAGHPADPKAAESAVPAATDTLRADPRAKPTAAAPPAGEKLTAEEMENIRRLPAADQPAAVAQRVCVVGGEPLGSMGVPRKVTAGGRSLFLCCKGCETEFQQKADEILRRLKAEHAQEEKR
jgi:hypothetical protein